MALITFRMLCSHWNYVLPNFFITQNQNYNHEVKISIPTFYQPLVTSNPLSACMNLSILETSCKYLQYL